MQVGEWRRGARPPEQEGAGGTGGRRAGGAEVSAAPRGRGAAPGGPRRRDLRFSCPGSLPGHPCHCPSGRGRRGSPVRAAGGRGASRGWLRGRVRAGLPWLLWGCEPAADTHWPPSPPACPRRHVGRKRRVTQRPKGSGGGSGGGGWRGRPRARRREAGGGGRRGRSAEPQRYGGPAGPRASRVLLQGGAGCGAGWPAAARPAPRAPAGGLQPPGRPALAGERGSRPRCTRFSDFPGIPSVGAQPPAPGETPGRALRLVAGCTELPS